MDKELWNSMSFLSVVVILPIAHSDLLEKGNNTIICQLLKDLTLTSSIHIAQPRKDSGLTVGVVVTAGWDLCTAWGKNLIIWPTAMMPVSKNSLASLKELQAISGLLSIAMNRLSMAFMAFRNCNSILFMFLTAEIRNLITQYTDVGCVLLQLTQYMQTTAKARSSSSKPPMPVAGCWKGLFTSHSFTVLSNPSVVCLWAVKELNLSLCPCLDELIRLEFPTTPFRWNVLPLSHHPDLPTPAYQKITEVKLRPEVKTDRGSALSITQVLLLMANAFVLQRDSKVLWLLSLAGHLLPGILGLTPLSELFRWTKSKTFPSNNFPALVTRSPEIHFFLFNTFHFQSWGALQQMNVFGYRSCTGI